MSGPAFNPEIYMRPGGIDGGEHGVFCGAAHPDNPPLGEEGEYNFCRRLKGRPCDELGHSAFVTSIAVPEVWFGPVELDHPDAPPF